MKNKKVNFFTYLVLSIVAIITLFPVLYTIFGAFKSTEEILLGGMNIFPENPTFDNFINAWVMADFSRYTWNSVVYAGSVMILTIINSTMAGYVYAKGQFPGKKIVYGIKTATMFTAMGSASLYPTLKIAGLLHLNNSIWGVVLLHAFGTGMSNILLVKSFVNSMPNAVFEAARIDGCGFGKTFIHIVFPMLKPMVATLAILSFKGAWNEYLLPMVFTMSNPEQAPLAVGLANLKNSSQAATDWGVIFAGACFCMIPVLIVYMLFNRFFVGGMNAGAVKE